MDCHSRILVFAPGAVVSLLECSLEVGQYGRRSNRYCSTLFVIMLQLLEEPQESQERAKVGTLGGPRACECDHDDRIKPALY